jgi:integral membrane sensor domain MASE1
MTLSKTLIDYIVMVVSMTHMSFVMLSATRITVFSADVIFMTFTTISAYFKHLRLCNVWSGH